MLSEIQGGTQRVLRRLEMRVQSSASSALRIVTFPVILALYLTIAIVHSLALLFGTNHDAFLLLYEPTAKKGYTTSYTDFMRRKQRIRMVSATSFALTIAASVLVNTLVSNVQPVYAATCNINTDTLVDQNYIDSNDCQDIHITGGALISFSGPIDLVGNGVFYIDNTVVMAFSGALNLSDAADAVVINGTVRSQVGDTTGVNITAQNVTINGTGLINQTGRGCAGGIVASRNGYGPDLADFDADLDTKECLQGRSGYGKSDRGGAAHGGSGGRQHAVSNPQSFIYGNDRAPSLNGSGGAAGPNGGENGGAGGGVVRLDVAGTLTVNGPINANGTNGAAASNGAGGGAGGSIYITAGTLAGTNSITANGGNGFNDGGGAGGGRVAVYYDSLTGFPLNNIVATKGLKGTGNSTDGGAGSTFILNRRSDDGAGDLRITSGLDFQNGGDYERANVTIDNGASLSCGVGLASLTLGGTGTLAMNGVNWKCGTADSVTIIANSWTTSNTNSIDISKAGATTTLDINTDLTFNNLTFIGPNAGTTSAQGGLLTMNETIAVALVNSSINSSVDWTNLTSLNIGSGSTINANNKGCPGGPVGSGAANDGFGLNGSGVCTQSSGGFGKNSRGGAAHASSGGKANSVANTQTATYGSDSAPISFGSGGAGGANAGENGGAGGGRIRIDTSGTLTVGGNITAQGGTPANISNGAGGGSGGSIYITAGTLAGTNSITANGGNGYADGGGGSAGRIAVYYDTLTTLPLNNISALGGAKGANATAANGGNGSTFILNRRTDDGAGDLRITTGIDFQSSTDYTRTNITFDQNASINCNSFATLNLGATGTLAMNGVNWKCSTIDTLNLSAGTWTTSNTNNVNFDKAGSTANWNISNDVTFTNFNYVGGNAGTTSADGGLLTMDNNINVTLNNSNINSNLFWRVKSLSIDGPSKLNASMRGCPSGSVVGGAGANGFGTNGSGVCAQTTAGYGKNPRGGAAHGGTGGAAHSQSNGQATTYGSNTAPVLMGSGAGSGGNSGEFGGAGGGKMRIIVASTLTVNGALQAGGGQGANTSSGAGGGAGGSIYVTTGILAGSGQINAIGGNGQLDGGGGGGGRAAVEYGSLSGFNPGNISAGGGSKGSALTAGAGGAGTTFTKILSVATTPTITAPLNNATDQSRNALNVTSSAYSSDGAAHATSDWQISDDNTFAASDCGSGHIVFCSMNSANLESITINPSSGSFQGALNGKTALAPNTTYYVRVRYNNGAGNSIWSNSIAFSTVANNIPATPTHSAPNNGATGISKNPTLTASAFSDADGDTHFVSDWAVYESADCSGTADWLANGSNQLTSIVVNSTTGVFADALAGQTTLKSHTTYSFRVAYSDGFNPSNNSTCTNFTTLNNAPTLTGTVSDQNFNEDGSVTNAFNLNSAITDVDFNDNGTLTCTTTNGLTAGLGTMTVNGNGSVDFSLASNANGSDTVQFSCQDGGGLSALSNTVSITINAVNDAPSFIKGSNQTVNEDAGAQTVNGWATSVNKGGNGDETSQVLTFNVGNDNNGLFSSQPGIDPTTGNLTYTPAANVSGSTIVTVNLSDNGGTANGGVNTSADQTFTITVNSTNDVPSFTKGADQAVNEDAGAQTVLGWATSINKGPSNESGQVLTFNVNNDNTALFSSQPAINATNGNLTYTPAANAFGVATVTVTLSDDGGTANGGVDTSAAQTFTITLNGSNDIPSFTKGADQTPLEDAGAQTVNGWATGISKGPSNESGQVLTFNVNNDNTALFSSQPAINAAGQLSYTTAANAVGSATVTVTLSDNGGTTNSGVDTSAAQTFTITVTAVNDEPSFTKGSNVSVAEDAGAQSLSAWATAISAGPGNESGQTVSFTLSNNNNSLFSSQPALTNSGALSFTPAANMNGTATVSILGKDNGGTANGGNDTALVQTFTITVTPVNDAPTLSIIPDQAVDEGDTLTIVITATDREGDTASFSVTDTQSDFADKAIVVGDLLTDNNNGTATFSWTPGSTLVGQYVLTFNTTDGSATSSDTVTITVNDSDGSPVFSGSLPVVAMVGGETASNVFDLDDYFVDPEGQALSYISSTPETVSVTIHTDHQVSITAPADFSGGDEVTFTATDPLGQTATSNVLDIVLTGQGEEDNIDLAQVSHVRGTQTGPGNVVIIGQDGQILADWTAYPVGGVIPRIGLASSEVFIYTVKNRSGSTMSIYSLNGALQRKKRISPKVHWRKLAVGNLHGDQATDEIVSATSRDHKIYFKVYSYRPRTKVVKLEKRTIYGQIRNRDYSVTIAQKSVHVVNTNGKTVFDWKPY